MPDVTQGDDMMGDDILPETPEHDEGKAKSFAPWHKPRKQWVRLNQWKSEIRELIQELGPLQRPLNYLTLPGDDLLDVRVVSDACLGENANLKFLGFNDGIDDDSAEQTISRSELREKAHVDQDSEIIPDRFEHIVEDGAVAEQRLCRHGSFDVVNLDLCGRFAGRQDELISYYTSAIQLAEHQIENGRDEPWLFFITTRCGKNDVTNDAAEKMQRLIKENIDNSHAFGERFFQAVEGYDLNFWREEKTLFELENLEFLRSFCIGLSKWFLQAMHPTGWEVRMLPSCYYTVQHGPDMLSLGLRFSPFDHKPVDRTGLALNAQTDYSELEGDLAAELIGPVRNLIDVDSKLESDATIKSEMIESSKALLSSARYDPDEYASWLRENDHI